MTLVEVVAALAILVVLSGGVLGFFFGVTARRDELALLASQQRDAASLLDRLEAALMTCVAVAPDGSAGVRGDGVSIEVATRAVAAAFEGAASVGDAARLGFAFDAAHASCQCTLEPLVGGGGGLSEPILAHVEGMRFRYLRGRDWIDSFDSLGDDGLPVAIEVSIWLEPRSGADAPEPPSQSEPAALLEEPDFGEDPASPPGEDEPARLPEDARPSLRAERPVWPAREPECTRIIVVPDGPEAAWRGGTT